MDEPRSELKVSVDDSQTAPDFESLTTPEALVSGGRTRDDFFDAVLGLQQPATAQDVADLAGRGVDAAREYLEWFERMGIVIQVTDRPATYKRNQAYLNWRRVQTLRREYAPETLLEFLETEAERVTELESEFNATSPDKISLTQYAEATDQPLEDVWERLSEWHTARRRITLLERALMTESNADTSTVHSAV